MRERNRLNSQEWAIKFSEEGEQQTPVSEPRQHARAIEEVIALLETGALDPTDSRVQRLRRVLDELQPQKYYSRCSPAASMGTVAGA
jgi:hypothetical protein